MVEHAPLRPLARLTLIITLALYSHGYRRNGWGEGGEAPQETPAHLLLSVRYILTQEMYNKKCNKYVGNKATSGLVSYMPSLETR